MPSFIHGHCFSISSPRILYFVGADEDDGAGTEQSVLDADPRYLFKSANPIVTIFLGLVWFRKHYPIRDYVVVLMLVIGLYIFMMGDTWYTATDTGTITDTQCHPTGHLPRYAVNVRLGGRADDPRVLHYTPVWTIWYTT